MKDLRRVTHEILRRVEEVTGRSIQFMRDDGLSLLATLQIARDGADYHVLRYKPTDEPLDYLIAYQAGFVLRLFESDPSNRFDFVPDLSAGQHVEPLLAAEHPLRPDDKKAAPEFAKSVAQWALMNLRSLPIGMRIDRWIATELPELKELQQASIALQQQQNTDLLSYKLGNLTVPTSLMAPIAAYALFADRLAGNETYAIPFEAVGVLAAGQALLRIWDDMPSNAKHDRELVDRWAAASGQSDWYRWIPYRP